MSELLSELNSSSSAVRAMPSRACCVEGRARRALVLCNWVRITNDSTNAPKAVTSSP